MKKVVLDIETQNSFAEIGSRDITKFDVSVVGVYDYETDQYFAYTVDDLSGLWQLLEARDMIIGFNSDYFDLPILNKYYSGDLKAFKSLDILAEINRSLGKMVSLDRVARATLNVGKSADGLQAIAWWKAGEIEKIKEYCLQDVRVTKEIYDFARANNYLLYEGQGESRRIPLDATRWEVGEKPLLNMTLPF